MSDSSRPTGIADTDVYITRAFDAPRALVWKFFMQPDLLASWFAPTAHSAPEDSIVVEPRVGGRWELAMVSDATGDSFPMRGTIVELVEPELLVLDVSAVAELGTFDNLFLRIQFHDHGDRTRITLHQGPFDRDAQHDTEIGWGESFVKLDAQLATAKG
ncbi:hypothetical protein ASE16_13985 [Leifsonia sp. Root227]|jgi:uncharacterized protein YndB with AHSA1/START domain|uniref:SRPBCC family protein n=1 Tax=unclassified Leifsonia TaxID=2663824 RepID=UPI0006F4387F|nr:SRPBCC domain-containing protein [Leifsonia sp. Root227]KRC49789.1 hypothetical protein ASE16_13985 [Leifsonia sp. Root227]